MRNAITIMMTGGLVVPVHAQLSISPITNEGQLVEIIEGWGVQVLEVNSSGCTSTAYGKFTGTSILDMSQGLVLTTGKASEVSKPASFFASQLTGSGSDPDLEILAGAPINDACRLIIDFTPLGDTLMLNYSFGSEEYPEYVCTGFNDVFGIFLSGPGYAGPFSDGGVNIATIPGGDIPIAINTVNQGVPGSAGVAAVCELADPNWQANSIYYINNMSGPHIVFDGLTVDLVAVAAVLPGEVYRMKIAVGDALDMSFDSGVFIEAFSLRSNLAYTAVPEWLDPVIGLEQHPDHVVALLPQGSAGVLQLIGSAGQLLREVRITDDRMPIHMDSLGAGLYILRVVGPQGIASLRFVKV